MHLLSSIFVQFFILGCTSFGGPAAHIGYFQQTFVQRHKWLNQQEFGHIVALSQFLPGPGSSQVGFAIGLHRAGVLGAITAFVAFTMPSVILMLCLYFIGLQFAHTTSFIGIVTGLKLLAVIVVADAIITMAKSFCRQLWQQLLALIVAMVLVFQPMPGLQLILLLSAAIIGRLFFTNKTALESNSSTRLSHPNWSVFIIFCLLLIFGLQGKDSSVIVQLFKDFYVAGSLVFGGGHVVLPLLQDAVASSIAQSEFLIGYAAAQAVPGPMFTLATYLGASILIDAPVLGALSATVAIFLPGFLLVLAFKPVWQQYAANPKLSGSLTAVNAAVVGLLIAAFYQPVFVSAIGNWLDFMLACIGFILLRWLKVPILLLVLSYAALGVLLVHVNL